VGLEYPAGVNPQVGMNMCEAISTHDEESILPIVLVQLDAFASERTCSEDAAPRVVPIFPTTMRMKTNAGSFTREQLPLRLARARTVHSAQGQTADEVVFAPTPTASGMKPFDFGLAYVALSRVRTMLGLWMTNKLEGIHFTAHNGCCALIDREYARLRALGEDDEDHLDDDEDMDR
jgi:hypothetical protein